MSDTPTHLTIVVDSRYGSTLAIAEAITAGGRSAGAEVRLCRAGEAEPEPGLDVSRPAFRVARDRLAALPIATADDLRWADGLALGAPTRYGVMTTAMRGFIDSLAPLWWQGELIGKPGAVFTSTGGMHSGHETTLLALLMTLFQHGMIAVGVPHSVPELVATRFGGSPLGAGAVTTLDGSRPIDSCEQGIAHALGARLARVAEQIEPEPAPVATESSTTQPTSA